MKVVVNRCFGGFGLSDEAFEEYLKRKGIEYTSKINVNGYPEFYDKNNKILFDVDIPRDDKILIGIVEEMGEKANGCCADLIVVEIPDDAKWDIEYYDGKEILVIEEDDYAL